MPKSNTRLLPLPISQTIGMRLSVPLWYYNKCASKKSTQAAIEESDEHDMEPLASRLLVCSNGRFSMLS